MAKNNKISANNLCFDGIVGIKNCGTTYVHYLDSYGFGLSKAIKTTDDAFVNAKEQVDTIIAQSIDEVIDKVHIQGFQANKILSSVSYGKVNKDGTFTGAKEQTFTIDEYLQMGSFHLSEVKAFVKTAGNLRVELIQDGVSEDLLNGAVVAGTKTITINRWVTDEFKIKVTTSTTTELYEGVRTTCGCGNYTVANEDESDSTYGLQVVFQVRCNKAKFFCKYSNDLAKAIIYNALGKLHFVHYTTSAFNNFINSTDKEKLLGLMVYYDSTYINLIDTERNPNEKNGQLQLELERVNKLIPKPTCAYCLECDEPGWRINKKLP